MRFHFLRGAPQVIIYMDALPRGAANKVCTPFPLSHARRVRFWAGSVKSGRLRVTHSCTLPPPASLLIFAPSPGPPIPSLKRIEGHLKGLTPPPAFRLCILHGRTLCTEHGPPDARVYERTQTRKRQQVQRIKLAERCGIQPVSELDPQVLSARSAKRWSGSASQKLLRWSAACSRIKKTRPNSVPSRRFDFNDCTCRQPLNTISGNVVQFLGRARVHTVANDALPFRLFFLSSSARRAPRVIHPFPFLRFLTCPVTLLAADASAL